MAHTDSKIDDDPSVLAELKEALAHNAKAAAAFDASSPSHRREYIKWIAGARQQATRDRRIAQAIERLAAGTSRR